MRACRVGTVLVFKCGARAVVRVEEPRGRVSCRRDVTAHAATGAVCHALALSPRVVASGAECFLKVQSPLYATQPDKTNRVDRA